MRKLLFMLAVPVLALAAGSVAWAADSAPQAGQQVANCPQAEACPNADQCPGGGQAMGPMMGGNGMCPMGGMGGQGMGPMAGMAGQGMGPMAGMGGQMPMQNRPATTGK